MTKKHHYSKDDLIEALQKTGIKAGDIVFSHSNIGFFGIPQNAKNVTEACQIIYEAFLEVLGETGTLIVPTFTYSFPKNTTYDPALPSLTMGAFSEFIQQHHGSQRSLDPCYSVAAIGPKTNALISNISNNSFGENSFFERFYQAGGKICNMNFDAGSTFIHFVERELKVPYRFDKKFIGTICINGQKNPHEHIISVRYLCSDLTTAVFEEFDKLAKQNNLYKTEPVGRGFIGVITAKDTYQLIQNTLIKRPWFLTKADQSELKPELIPE